MEKGFHLETVKRYIENKETEELLNCLESLEPNAVLIGEGKNAEVFGLDEGKFKSVCMKKIKENPELKCNDIDMEVDFQNRVKSLGVKTPLTFAFLKDTESKEEFILMERIEGCSIGDIVYGNSKVPDKYNHKKFFENLKNNIKTLHENNIHHRDLHEGNVMIDEKGDPVLIDFGTACTAFSGDEHPYGEQVRMLNKETGRYEFRNGYFKDDERMLYQLEVKMREFARNVQAY